MDIVLSDFELKETKGRNCFDWEYLSEVLVTTTTGVTFLEKTTAERRLIRRTYGGPYYFVDSGEFCPGRQAETLARSWAARTGQDA